MPSGIYPRKNSRKFIKCKICSKEFFTWLSIIKRGGGKFCSEICCHKFRIGKKLSEKWIENLKKSHIGKHSSPKTEFKIGSKGHWKGGRRIDKKWGYVFVYQPNHPFVNSINYVREHRLVIEKQIEHYLLPNEKTHHLNGIKTDNRPENLMAFVSHSAHMRFEQGGIVKPEEIIFDGRNYHYLR